MMVGEEQFAGVLLGTMVGDSLGLPAEGLSRRRTRRLFASPWRQRFFLSKGMISDDTEHTIMMARALIKHADDSDKFVRHLAWGLRYWILSLPAGTGMATARACLKLCLGWQGKHSGVFSAGNGPAMRAALIGLRFRDQALIMKHYVSCSTKLTHTDPKAFYGALAVARTAAWMSQQNTTHPPDFNQLFSQLRQDGDQDWFALLLTMEHALADQCTVETFADRLSLQKGVSGYVYHTVPVAIYSCLVHYGDFRHAVESVLSLGGDTDTTGAICGAMMGAHVGRKGIPKAWIQNVVDWPRGLPLLERLAKQLADKQYRGEPADFFWPGALARNVFFLLVVLMHAFRRALPPY